MEESMNMENAADDLAARAKQMYSDGKASIYQAAVGARAVMSDVGSYMADKTKAAGDNNYISNTITGIADGAASAYYFDKIQRLKTMRLQGGPFGPGFTITKTVVNTGGNITKWISKWFPIANALAMGYGWYKDWQKYDGWELAKAALCTFAGGVVGVVAGIGLAALGVTAAPVLIIGTVIGVGASFAFDAVKESWCTPTPQPAGGQ